MSVPESPPNTPALGSMQRWYQLHLFDPTGYDAPLSYGETLELIARVHAELDAWEQNRLFRPDS